MVTSLTYVMANIVFWSTRNVQKQVTVAFFSKQFTYTKTKEVEKENNALSGIYLIWIRDIKIKIVIKENV